MKFDVVAGDDGPVGPPGNPSACSCRHRLGGGGRLWAGTGDGRGQSWAGDREWGQDSWVRLGREQRMEAVGPGGDGDRRCRQVDQAGLGTGRGHSWTRLIPGQETAEIAHT